MIKSKGNMYDWVDYTWNPIKGKCEHDCSYCYMKRFGKQNPIHLDKKELKKDLGKNNKIFVGSSIDLFANDIPDGWIRKVFNYISNFDNTYYFQSKNVQRMWKWSCEPYIFGTTIETNRTYEKIMQNSPPVETRGFHLGLIPTKKFITIEPIMDFDMNEFIHLIEYAQPNFVNVGADSGNNKLPEPSKEKILNLINELSKFTKVNIKSNLLRLIKGK